MERRVGGEGAISATRHHLNSPTTQHFGDAVRVTVDANVLPYWFKQLQGTKN